MNKGQNSGYLWSWGKNLDSARHQGSGTIARAMWQAKVTAQRSEANHAIAAGHTGSNRPEAKVG